MTVLKNLVELSRRVILWQRFGLAASVLVLTGVLVAGFAATKHSLAAVGRSCGDELNGVHNSIANNPNSGGGCGALSPEELVDQDIPNGNPDDQGAIFAHFGLPSSEFARFKSEAVMGVAKQDGTVVDDEGNIVMTDAWSIGRLQFSYGSPYTPLSGVGSYFRHAHTDVLQQDLPIMLLFDKEGTVQAAVLTSCGNPSNGEKVKSGADCHDLISTPVEGKKNTYDFTTDASKFGFTEFLKFEYFFDEGDGEKSLGSANSATEPVRGTFAKDATVRVKITISVPGHQERVIVDDDCVKEIKVKKEAVFFACKNLVATPLDNTNRKFRFTAHTDQSANVQAVSADFSIDGTVVAEGIDDKDDDGRIFWDKSFSGDKEHIVSAIVNFKKPDGSMVQSTEKCEVKIIPEKKPIPVQVLSVKKVTPTVAALPVTGPAGLMGLFAGVSAVGAVGHHLFATYRSRRQR